MNFQVEGKGTSFQLGELVGFSLGYFLFFSIVYFIFAFRLNLLPGIGYGSYILLLLGVLLVYKAFRLVMK